MNINRKVSRARILCYRQMAENIRVFSPYWSFVPCFSGFSSDECSVLRVFSDTTTLLRIPIFEYLDGGRWVSNPPCSFWDRDKGYWVNI